MDRHYTQLPEVRISPPRPEPVFVARKTWGYAFLAASFVLAVSFIYLVQYGRRPVESSVCIQVVTPAKNLQTGEVRDFPTPCDVPTGWEPLKTQILPESPTGATFVNDNPSFTFIYPSNWAATEADGQICLGEIGRNYVVEESTVCGVLVMYYKDNPNATGISRLVEMRKAAYPDLTVESGTVSGGIPVTRMRGFGDSAYFKSGGYTYSVSDSGHGLTGDVISQILATFKFGK